MKVQIITAEGCSHCTKLKKKIEEMGGDSDIEFIDIYSEDGGKITDQFEIEVVPTAIREDGVRCEIQYDKDDNPLIICPELDKD